MPNRWRVSGGGIMHTNDGLFMRHASPNLSDDDSAMTTLPIGERKFNSDYDPDEMQSLNEDVLTRPSTDYKKITSRDLRSAAGIAASHKILDRNTFACWAIVVIMLVLALGNLALTMTIIGVLRIGKGMEHMELVPEANTVKFFGITDLDRIYKKDGRIEGFEDDPVTITGDNSQVQISLMKPNGHNHNRILMSKNGTTVHGVSQFDVKTPTTGETVFSTHRPHFNIPSGLENLHAKVISSSRITAAIDDTLSVNNTRGKILFRGTEGVRINAKDLLVSADQNIYLRSHNGSIVIDALNGVNIDVRNIPIVGEHGVKLDNTHFKMCVCMPQGRLFRIPVATSSHVVKGMCSHFDPESDPCA